jgi:predicted transposase/invertase (TIGR01784 family)
VKQVGSLRYGVIFKKAFSHPEIFTSFVRDVLGIELEISSVETEKSFSPTVGPIDSRFDLFAEDVKNRVIVDIQHQRLKDHYDKFLHYHCVALLEQAARSSTYRSDVRVFTVVVLTSGDRHKTDVAVIDFDPRDRAGQPLGEIQHKIIYLCPKYVADDTPEPLREWLLAIDDTLDEEVDETQYRPEISSIFDYIEKSCISPRDAAEMKEEAAREEKLKELEDELKAVKSNLDVAKIEERKAIARTMLNNGLSIEQVANCTQLSVEQITALNIDNQYR